MFPCFGFMFRWPQGTIQDQTGHDNELQLGVKHEQLLILEQDLEQKRQDIAQLQERYRVNTKKTANKDSVINELKAQLDDANKTICRLEKQATATHPTSRTAEPRRN